MLPKLRGSIKNVKCSRQVYLNTYQIIRHVATAKTLEPVTLSYATYDTAVAKEHAPPLVLLHGLFGSKSNWATLCKRYQHETDPPRKVIAIDIRNHGESEHSENHSYAHLAADIRAFLAQFRMKKVALIGHSMGGRAVMLFSLKYPELVDRLIVGDISPVTDSPNLNTIPTILQALDSVDFPTNMSLSQARAAVDSQLSKSIPEKYLRSFLLTNLVQRDNGSFNWRVNVPALLSNFNHISRFPLVNDLQYEGPVLFVGGGNSGFIQKSDYPKILKLFPNAEMKFIDGAGHFLHSEKPAEFLDITLEFLNK